MKVQLIYPAGFSIENKELELNELEFNALLNCKKVGSEGKYFSIEELIFEDTKDGFLIAVLLA